MNKCTGLTLSGSKCKRSENCQWHKPKDNCAICFEQVATRYPTNCMHIFHEQCITQWYLHSDVCPVCRATQDADKFVVFKKALDDIVGERYADAIRTLEAENMRLRHRLERFRDY